MNGLPSICRPDYAPRSCLFYKHLKTLPLTQPVGAEVRIENDPAIINWKRSSRVESCGRQSVRCPRRGARLISRVFKAFRYRDFRLMWIGACASSIGTWMQIVAQGWLIYRVSLSAFYLSLDQVLVGIPISL